MLLLIKILSFLPLVALYALGDVITYPILYYVVRYRRRVVAKNLRLSFPKLSDRERKAIERRFYHHLVDIVAEIIWSYRASEEQIRAHFVAPNVDEVERWAQQKGGVIFMLGHLGNWEWTADVQHRFEQPYMQHYNVYRRLHNPAADKAMNAVRERRSGVGSNIEKNNLLRKLISLKAEILNHKLNITLGLIADQKPSPRNAHYRTTFMNQDTAFLDGGEVIARKFDLAVTYVHITSPKRGYYTAQVELITDDAPHTEPNFITEQFARRLEANIRLQPELWLWSHNRWKWSAAQNQ